MKKLTWAMAILSVYLVAGPSDVRLSNCLAPAPNTVNLSPRQFVAYYLDQVCAKLAKRTTSVFRSSKSARQWKLYLQNKVSLFNYPKAIQLDFLKAVNAYLDNIIPGHQLFRDIKRIAPLLNQFAVLTDRFLLLTDESVAQLIPYLEAALQRAKKRSGKVSIVELSAGYGDISYALRKHLSKEALGLERLDIIPTDLLFNDSDDYAYDQDIIKKRGVKAFDITQIQTADYKQQLGLSPDTEVVFIASHLPHNKGLEKLLLNSPNVHELTLIHTVTPQKFSGDTRVLPNPHVWENPLYTCLDDQVFFNGAVYSSYYDKGLTRENLQLYCLSRKSDKEKGYVDAADIPGKHFLSKQDHIDMDDLFLFLYGNFNYASDGGIIFASPWEITLLPENLVKVTDLNQQKVDRILEVLSSKRTNPMVKHLITPRLMAEVSIAWNCYRQGIPYKRKPAIIRFVSLFFDPFGRRHVSALTSQAA